MDVDVAADKRVEHFIRDPIRTSLRATIREKGTSFKLPADNGREFLFNLSTLDVWEDGHATTADHVEFIPSPHLPNEIFKSNTVRKRLKVRLLVTYPRFSVWDPDYDGAKQVHYLPFMPDDMFDLIEGYHLPHEWLQLRYLSPEVGNYFRKTDWGKSSRPHRIGIVIHFPFSLLPARRYDYLEDLKDHTPMHSERPSYHPFRDDLFLWNVAMSYSFDSGQTRGLLDGVPPRAQQDIRARMSPETSPWLDHPLHLPKVLLDIHVDHVAWEVNRLVREVDDLEDFSKNSKNKALEDTDSITTQLSFISRLLDFLENLTKFLLETLDFFSATLPDVSTGTGSSPNGGPAMHHQTFIRNTHYQMKEDLTNTLSLLRNNVETCDYLQSRTADSLNYISALYADDDATISARDARSNSTMSILQMVFLPATAVAAICSMGIFDWNPPPNPSGVGVSSYFWIYWVVSLIATFLTLIVWAFWIRRQGRKQRPDEVEKRDQMNEARFRERVARERSWVEGGMKGPLKGSVVGKGEKPEGWAGDVGEMIWGEEENKPRMRRKSRSRSRSQHRNANPGGYDV
ncbi:hypothetical protein MMC10_006107 [Thelotrema lepadinum]|nr:hypothetical protein [Thelotrema lepadinum]